MTPEPEATSVSPEPEATSVSPEPEATSVNPEPEATPVNPEPEATSVNPEPEAPGRQDHSQLDYAVVIPTIGRLELAALVAAADQQPMPRCIVVADDRRQPAPELDLPVTRAPLVVVRTGGRGPAAARNAGWRSTDAEWVAFLDDDVLVADDWARQLDHDLMRQPPSVGACQARLHVPLPPGQRPTDEQRRTTGLVGSQWITADMAYRRTALEATGGFDERFPRAFREDSDLAYRTIQAGYAVVWGDRVTTHPLVSRGGWRSSIRAQAGNADSALLRAKYGPRWRERLSAGHGRTPQHLATVLAAGVAVTGLVARRPGVLALGGLVWGALTADFAVRRIAPGPRTADEIITMVVTSAAIPPAALAHRLLGEYRVRRQPYSSLRYSAPEAT